MSKLRNSEFWDKRISWYIVLFFIVQAMNLMIKTVLPVPEEIWNRISLGFGLVSLSYLLLFCVSEVLRRGGRLLLQMLLLFSVLYLCSIFSACMRDEPVNLILSFSALWCFSWWLPIGICAFTIKDYKILYSVFVKSSYVILAMLIICFLGRNNLGTNKIYNMSFGFQIILPTLIHISEYYLKRKWYFILLIALEVLMIILYANRSILLSLTFFVAFIVVLGNINFKRKFLIVSSISILVLFYIFAGDSLLSGVVSVLDSKDISSRTITMMYEHNLDRDTGREKIWECCSMMIQDKPILGWGLGGEYYELSRLMGYVNNESIIGTHNMLIQFFVEFGVFVGFILCLMVVTPIFKLHKIEDVYKFLLLVICYSATIVPCLISAAEPMQKPAMALFLFVYYKKAKIQINKADSYQNNQKVATVRQ